MELTCRAPLPCQMLYGRPHHVQRLAKGRKNWFKDLPKVTLKRDNINPSNMEEISLSVPPPSFQTGLKLRKRNVFNYYKKTQGKVYTPRLIFDLSNQPWWWPDLHIKDWNVHHERIKKQKKRPSLGIDGQTSDTPTVTVSFIFKPCVLFSMSFIKDSMICSKGDFSWNILLLRYFEQACKGFFSCCSL